MTPEILQHWYRVAFCAWACLTIGLLVAREAVRETGWRRTAAAWLARCTVLMAMLILTRFGDHTVREYAALAEVVSKSEGGDGVTHSISEIQIAQVTHVDRYKSPDGWQAEFETYGAGRISGGAAGFLPAAGGRGRGGWRASESGDEFATRSAPGSALVPGGSGRSGWPIGQRF